MLAFQFLRVGTLPAQSVHQGYRLAESRPGQCVMDMVTQAHPQQGLRIASVSKQEALQCAHPQGRDWPVGSGSGCRPAWPAQPCYNLQRQANLLLRRSSGSPTHKRRKYKFSTTASVTQLISHHFCPPPTHSCRTDLFTLLHCAKHAPCPVPGP